MILRRFLSRGNRHVKVVALEACGRVKHESGETQTCKEPLNIPLAPIWRCLNNRFMGSEPAAIAGAIQEALWLPSLAQQAACPFRESKKWTTCRPVDLGKHQKVQTHPQALQLVLTVLSTALFVFSEGQVEV